MLGFGFDLLRGRDSGFKGKIIARLVIVVVNGTRDLEIFQKRESGNIAFFIQVLRCTRQILKDLQLLII